MVRIGGTESTLTGEVITLVEMPFRRRMSRRSMPMRAPIISYKHQFQQNTSYTGNADNEALVLFTGMEPGAQASPTTVPAGNKVYSVDVSVNYIQTSSSGNATINWVLCHLRSGQTYTGLFSQPGGADWSVIGLSSGRNQIIKSFMNLVGSEDAGGYRVNLHIKIPKLFHRVREGDQLLIIFNGSEVGALQLGARYKSYS